MIQKVIDDIFVQDDKKEYVFNGAFTVIKPKPEYTQENYLNYREPYNKAVNTLEAWSKGGDAIGQVDSDFNTMNYRVYLKDTSATDGLNPHEIWIQREVEKYQIVNKWTGEVTEMNGHYKLIDLQDHKAVLGDNPVVSELDFTFDQNMNVYLIIKANSIWYRYYYLDNKWNFNSLANKMEHCKICLDCWQLKDIGKSDIVLAYINKNTNKLCYCHQSTGFTDEKVIQDARNAYVQKIGFTRDDKLAIQVRGIY